MRQREREGRKQKAAEPRTPPIAPPAVGGVAIASSSIVMAALVGMTNPEAWIE
jgi:hypothetical protein